MKDRLSFADLGFPDLSAMSPAELKQMTRDGFLTPEQLAEALLEVWRRNQNRRPMLGVK